MQVGPRACPRLWGPDADVDCEVGDVLPCEEGWVESGDGLYCEPVYDECPFGERPLLGGGCQRVVPLAEDCPPGPFPEAPEGATDLVYVLAGSACTEGCGSAAAPFASIQAALNAVPEGGWVLVGEGEYAEGVGVLKPVGLAGLCAARVEISGTVPVEGLPSGPLDVGLAVAETQDVKISGVSVASGGIGLFLGLSNNVEVTSVELSGNAGTGVYMVGGSALMERVHLHDTAFVEPNAGVGWGIVVSQATLVVRDSVVESNGSAGFFAHASETTVQIEDSVVRDTVAFGDIGAAYGVAATQGAKVEILGSVIEGTMGVGVQASEAGTEVAVKRSVIRRTLKDLLGDSGVGASAFAGSTLAISASFVSDNSTYGVALFGSETSAILSRTVVSHTGSGVSDIVGTGAVALSGGNLSISGSLFEANSADGVSLAHAGTTAEVRGTLVRDALPGVPGSWATGIWVRDGAELSLSYSLIDNNRGAAIEVTDNGTAALLQSSVLRNTLPGTDGLGGHGLRVAFGPVVAVSDCLLEGNMSWGAQVTEEGSEVQIARTVIRDTKINPEGGQGQGLSVSKGAALHIWDSVVVDNHSVGVAAGYEGTKVLVEGCVVRDTARDGEGKNGAGVGALAGAEVVVVNSLLADNVESGAFSFDAGTQLLLQDTAVIGSGTAAGNALAAGVEVAEGAGLVASDCLFRGNSRAGVNAAGTGSDALLEGVLVCGTLPTGQGTLDCGVQAVEGAWGAVRRSLLEGNGTCGAMVSHKGSTLAIEASTVRGTLPDGEGRRGYGAVAVKGGVLTVTDSLIAANHDMGLGASDEGTRLALRLTVVADTVAAPNSVASSGLFVAESAVMTVSGGLLEGNAMLGALALGEQSELLMTGSLISNTVSGPPPAEYASGLLSGEGATAELLLSQVNGSRGTGLLSFGSGSAVRLAESAVTGTEEGTTSLGPRAEDEVQTVGDGILVVDGGRADVEFSLLHDNSRCGAYFFGAQGSLSDSLLFGNGSFGLALEESAQDVTYEAAGNYFFGNAADLPAGAVRDISTAPKGLPAPAVPQIGQLRAGTE